MIIGLDIGTSVTKAGLVARDGSVIHVASEQSRVTRLPGGLVEQDLEQVIDSVSTVVRQVAASAEASGIEVEALAITAQGDGLWLRDAAGHAVRPAISWSDGRANELVSSWVVGGSDSVQQQVYDLTGSGIFPGSQAALIAYLDEHEPESLERATVAGYCADSVLQRLTGVSTVDASDASLPFLNVTTREYVDAALELCGIAQWRHLLTPPAEPGAVFALDAVGSRLTGLPVGTPVTAGPYDLQACAFGSGSIEPGDGSIVFGTSLATQVFTTDARVNPGDEPAGMWLCTPDPKLFLRVMPSMVGASSLAWLQRVLDVDVAELSRLLEASNPGANGVRALSFFSPSGERAPFVDPNAWGQFVGLSLDTGRADLARALVESIAFATRNCFDTLGGDGELTATGGAINAAGAAQIFADVLGRAIHLPEEDLVGARGAAFVAWRSLGRPVDLAPWRARRTVIEADPKQVAFYDRAYANYLADLDAAKRRWSDPDGSGSILGANGDRDAVTDQGVGTDRANQTESEAGR